MITGQNVTKFPEGRLEISSSSPLWPLAEQIMAPPELNVWEKNILARGFYMVQYLSGKEPTGLHWWGSSLNGSYIIWGFKNCWLNGSSPSTANEKVWRPGQRNVMPSIKQCDVRSLSETTADSEADLRYHLQEAQNIFREVTVTFDPPNLNS